MHVFVTGASGYIGRHLCIRLIGDGHAVSGLARSDPSARRLAELGVAAHPGAIEDVASVVAGAAAADAVVHIPPSHDFTGGDEADQLATRAMLDCLAGSGRHFVYTSGARVYGDTHGIVVDEDTQVAPPPSLIVRAQVEQEVLAAANRDVAATVIRPTLTYGAGASGAMNFLIDELKITGRARYIGDGNNAWSFVHVDDLADLYAAVLRTHAATGRVLNASAGKPVPLRDLAAALAATAEPPASAVSVDLNEALAEWGEMAVFLSSDMRVSGERAREMCGWQPHRVGVIDDVRSGSYVAALRR